MAAERPTQADRSWFGSWCAIALAAVCLTSAFVAGCLNPLTDDQPSSRPSPSVTGPIDTSPPPASSAGGDPGDFLVDEEGGEAAPSSPRPAQPGDAGLIELDAGADSGTSEPLP